ncbi:glycosyltransferase family 2 protein [Alkalinema sp. FACHB-956]|uniref:glycosyltransferase family 2 protein n=1 Tax=Alkalinema sp. FACHB-956 TaxID=2692768 RepID=UPI0016829A7B|nr:glycosyltransferase family 2 protein [Alkalinema sp. FACHB-956]MBD2329616.1 glycosyltransferase family 2 protein [Alkalinema sp. FACHB-956]
MQSSPPTVAVCIPTYNQAQYLRLAVESICQQTYPNLEVWVSDDASTDDTQDVMAQLCQQYQQVHYYRQPKNLGIAGNNSWLLRQPQTDYIIRLDSDDLLLPDYVTTLLALLEKYPDAGYAHAAVQEIDQFGNQRGIRRVHRSHEYHDGDTALKASVTGYRVAANICMFRAPVLRELNFYEGRPDFAEDYDLSVRIADAGYGNVYSPKILSCYRVWTDAQGTRPRRKGLEIRGLIRTFEETMIPAFQRRGWNTQPIWRSRRSLALNHAASCYEPWFTSQEKAELTRLLLELGDCLELRLRLQAIQLGLGPLFSQIHRINLTMKGIVKGVLARA